MFKEAITALQEGTSIKAANSSLSVEDVSALPSDYALHDLEKYMHARRRVRGTMATSVLASFAAYCVLHGEAGAAVFINPQDMAATAVLNLGNPEQPGHADNLAKLTLKKTAAYTALTQHANGTGYKQATIAEFLEDWAEHVTCFNDAGPVTTPKAIAAIRKLTIESMRKLESSVQQLGASMSAFESVQASSVDPLPTTLYFDCQPYADLNSRQFVLRLGVLTSGEKPTVNLRIVKDELHAEEMANELATLIEGHFSSDAFDVLLGSYSKGQ